MPSRERTLSSQKRQTTEHSADPTAYINTSEGSQELELSGGSHTELLQRREARLETMKSTPVVKWNTLRRQKQLAKPVVSVQRDAKT